MRPDICTSTRCKDYGDYCRECPHAIWLGDGPDQNGKIWRWEFTPRFGPMFVGKRGEPLGRQPVQENHRAWEPFEKWHKKKFGKEEI